MNKIDLLITKNIIFLSFSHFLSINLRQTANKNGTKDTDVVKERHKIIENSEMKRYVTQKRKNSKTRTNSTTTKMMNSTTTRTSMTMTWMMTTSTTTSSTTKTSMMTAMISTTTRTMTNSKMMMRRETAETFSQSDERSVSESSRSKTVEDCDRSCSRNFASAILLAA